MKIQHFIITRSNYDNKSNGMLQRRRQITTKLTETSLLDQTDQRFQWIVCEGLQTFEFPKTARRARMPNVPSVAGQVDRLKVDWWDVVSPLLDPAATHILTTRLDDDDALIPHFVERLRDEVDKWEALRSFVFPVGYHAGLFNKRCQPFVHRTNQFASLLAPVEEKRTVYDVSHNKLHIYAPMTDLSREAAWLWSVHPDSISHKTRRMRYPLKNLIPRFPCVKRFC